MMTVHDFANFVALVCWMAVAGVVLLLAVKSHDTSDKKQQPKSTGKLKGSIRD